jgi:tRNA (Thr-GGU) A37 N-methylase
VNAKHAESSLKISDESVGGLTILVPFCHTQGCQWSGGLHHDETSARREGHAHLAKHGVAASRFPDGHRPTKDVPGAPPVPPRENGTAQ